MRDLTEGSIAKHLVHLATPIAVGMLFQTLYFLVDLYFIGRLGEAAIAGVGAAGNVQFVVLAATQTLRVGTMAVIAHAVGRKDRADANLIFNQSLILAAACAVATLVGGLLLVGPYMQTLAADAETTEAGLAYLYFYLPGLACQFALAAMAAALTGTGITKPPMVAQMGIVMVNTVLSPILITGWGTGRPLGTAGAGLATSISTLMGVIFMTFYFVRLEKYVVFDRKLLLPRLSAWWRILRIGIPTGGEFALIFVYMAVTFWAIRDFGAAAQAGFGVGTKVTQAIMLPAMAIAFATGPVAGQNFGGRRFERVRRTFLESAKIGSALMLVVTLICQWRPEFFVRAFSQDPSVVAIGAEFLGIISFNYIASSLIFTCSGMFQGLGNTIPGVISASSRMLTFVLPTIWMARQGDFELSDLWYLSVASIAIQALCSIVLARIQMRRRLVPDAPLPPMPIPAMPGASPAQREAGEQSTSDEL